MKPLTILHLPSYHPAVSKIFDKKLLKIANPNVNSFEELNTLTMLEFSRKYPLKSYDVVHVHFEYYLIPVSKFEQLLKYFKKNGKPIVWTWHDKRSLLDRDADYRHEKLLLKYSDKIITPTNGMREWIESTFGIHKQTIEVIPLGLIATPALVKKIKKTVRKNKNLFTILVGDFRDSKEYIQSIINFIQSTELENARLQIIFRPVNIYKSLYKDIRWDLIAFNQIIQHPQIEIFCKISFSDEEIAEAYYKSHAIVLPHKWGDHSAQIELAKDCGCHVIVPNIGFYREQNDKIWEYKITDGLFSEFPIRYVQQLVNAYRSPSLQPMGEKRQREHLEYLNLHYLLYEKVILLNKQKVDNEI